MFKIDESEQRLFLDLLTNRIYNQLQMCGEFIKEWAMLANDLERSVGEEPTDWEEHLRELEEDQEVTVTVI